LANSKAVTDSRSLQGLVDQSAIERNGKSSAHRTIRFIPRIIHQLPKPSHKRTVFQPAAFSRREKLDTCLINPDNLLACGRSDIRYVTYSRIKLAN